MHVRVTFAVELATCSEISGKRLECILIIDYCASAVEGES